MSEQQCEPTLMVFWEYDRFPYTLCGPVEKILKGGFVKPTNYGGYTFKPLIILPIDEGCEIRKKIEKLSSDYRIAQDKLHREYTKKLKEIAPFSKPLK